MTPAEIVALISQLYDLINKLGMFAKNRVEEDDLLTDEEKKQLIANITFAQNSVPEWK